MNDNIQNTMMFDRNRDKKDLTKAMLTEVYDSLIEKGYNPVN